MLTIVSERYRVAYGRRTAHAVQYAALGNRNSQRSFRNRTDVQNVDEDDAVHLRH